MSDLKPSLATGSATQLRRISGVPSPLARPRRERGIGLRARTSCWALLSEGPHVARCLAVELSASGIVIDRGRQLSERERSASLKLELHVPGNPQTVRALVKVARQVTSTSYALKFVLISDVDRLNLMEHLDREQANSLRLLEEVEGAA